MQSAKMCGRENAYSEGFAVSWAGVRQRELRAVSTPIAAPFLPTQLLFVCLSLLENRDAAVHGWVGDLSLGANCRAEMKAENNNPLSRP